MCEAIASTGIGFGARRSPLMRCMLPRPQLPEHTASSPASAPPGGSERGLLLVSSGLEKLHPRWRRTTNSPPMAMAVFDVVVNNADGKGDHILVMGDGYGVDHGLTFHKVEGQGVYG